MRNMLVAGNWKMNGTRASVETLTATLKAAWNKVESRCLWVICPPAVFLAQVKSALDDTRLNGDVSISLGAQNLDHHDAGAFTGEVSSAMLLEQGCEYVIVGHSERRALYAESNELVAEKFKAAVHSGLKPILCVGETREQRKAGDVEVVIREQLAAVIRLAGIESFASAVVAYEPVWAIGTGDSATPEQAEAVHKLIRVILGESNADVATAVQVLYGGSVNEANADELFEMPNIDGALVGGASLKADSFAVICQAAGRAELAS